MIWSRSSRGKARRWHLVTGNGFAFVVAGEWYFDSSLLVVVVMMLGVQSSFVVVLEEGEGSLIYSRY
jgi:hypothetical protein